jgi:putative transposase
LRTDVLLLNISPGQGAVEMSISFKWKHFQKGMILMAVRWYVAYALSYRNIEELMAERGASVDHSTLNRWVVEYAPLLEDSFRRHHKKSTGSSWRMDETYIKVKGEWYYLYRAVDKEGQTIDFMLSKNRDREAAERFLEKAIGYSGIPDKVTIDKSGANKAGLEAINLQLEILLMWTGQFFEIRQIKYLNNVVEQDHRAVKRIVNPMMGFKAFESAEATLAGIELYHMLRKGQHRHAANLPIFEQFYALAA